MLHTGRLQKPLGHCALRQHASVTIYWTTATCIIDVQCPSELQSSWRWCLLNSWDLLRVTVTSCLYCVFGMAKSQAVSWAHFHMARTRRVKPMSLGFSNPRISRCFMMAMNSLLLSSPFPGEDGHEDRVWVRGGYDWQLLYNQSIKIHVFLLFM